MKPSIGRIVMHRGVESNVAVEHPAIITRVWSDVCVNLTVFPDAGVPVARASQIFLADPEAEAGSHGWWWPPRVEG